MMWSSVCQMMNASNKACEVFKMLKFKANFVIIEQKPRLERKLQGAKLKIAKQGSF